MACVTIGTEYSAGGPRYNWSNALKPAGKHGAPITLTVDGRTDYVIIMPDNPTTQERKATRELALDIACEDPPALKHVDSSMYMRIANDRDSIILLFRVTDLDDDEKGELRFRVGTNDEQEWTVLNNVVVFDDDVQKRPLVHHLRIKGHFDGVDPYCEVILIDPVGVVHRARGTGKFADSVRTAVSPAVIRFDTAPNTADHLLDNVRFSVPDQANKHLAPDRFISVGRTGLLKAACLPDADADLGEEGYVIAQRGDNLFLIGGTSRGPINAVFSLLEEDLGCRWYTSTRCASASAITRIPRRLALSFDRSRDATCLASYSESPTTQQPGTGPGRCATALMPTMSGSPSSGVVHSATHSMLTASAICFHLPNTLRNIPSTSWRKRMAGEFHGNCARRIRMLSGL